MRVLSVVAFCLLLAVSALGARLAPLEKSEDAIPDEYIVLFHENVTSAEFLDIQNALATALSGAESRILKAFEVESFRALHMHLKEEDGGLAKVRSHPRVTLVEANKIMTASACTTQQNVVWNLRRVDEVKPNLVDAHYTYDKDGSGVTVYVIDTGVLTTHSEFEGRAIFGANFAGDGKNSDCNGHGTHVAGTVAGSKYGVAKKATIIAVKVLNCQGSGTNAGVISGIEWAYKHAAGKRSVANLSLGGGASTTVDKAINDATSAGLVMVVAAGNDNADACNYSPARASSAITVGATTQGPSTDARSYFSNFGTCVHILAPGSNILSAWWTSNSATNTISGTSMASPHVAGAAALFLQRSPNSTPAQIKEKLIAAASTGLINMECSATSPAPCTSTPNRMLYTQPMC